MNAPNLFFFLEQSYLDSNIVKNLSIQLYNKYGLTYINKPLKGMNGQMASIIGYIPEEKLAFTIRNLSIDLDKYRPFVTPTVFLYEGYWFFHSHISKLNTFNMGRRTVRIMPTLVHMSVLYKLIVPSPVLKLLYFITHHNS